VLAERGCENLSTSMAGRRSAAWVSTSSDSSCPTRSLGMDHLVVDGFSAVHCCAVGRLLKQAVERLALALIERAEHLVLDC
jgi:hypothetical protein